METTPQTPTENGQPGSLRSGDLFAFLNEQSRKQMEKANEKRRVQRDAQLMAEMHDECRYVILDIIDHVKKLTAEANIKVTNAPAE